MNIDTERVINEVRIRPALWDLKHTLYKDRDAKLNYWLEVYQTLFPEYDEYADAKKKDIEKQVQQRWKTARDAYVRSKQNKKNQQSGSGSSGKKTYIYYEQMKFLEKRHLIPVEDSSSESGENSVFDENNAKTPSNNSNQLGYESSASNQSNIKTKKQKRKKQTADIDGGEIEKEMFKLFKDNAAMMKNDDMLFFMSLLPITSNFTNYQKLIFRTEVLKKAMEICESQQPVKDPR